jgi:methylmalonyl-CoA mutase
LGLPTGFARRIARNTQIILQEESHLGRVADQAGGSFAIEKLAHDLDETAWGLFQQIEGEGGLEASLASGALQARVATVRAERMKNIARRKDAIVGVGEFANLGEAPVEVLKADPAPVLARARGAAVVPVSRGVGDLVRAAEAGASLVDLAGTGVPMVAALPPMRLAAGFEALRDKADVLGDRAVVFLATLGSLAEFNARSTFAKNAFEAGGLAALAGETEHGDDGALAASFKASGASLACLCGADAAYAERGASAAAALKAAGASGVWLAGRPGDLEASLRASGVDRFVFAGADVLAELTHAHGLLAAQGDAA